MPYHLLCGVGDGAPEVRSLSLWRVITRDSLPLVIGCSASPNCSGVQNNIWIKFAISYKIYNLLRRWTFVYVFHFKPAATTSFSDIILVCSGIKHNLQYFFKHSKHLYNNVWPTSAYIEIMNSQRVHGTNTQPITFFESIEVKYSKSVIRRWQIPETIQAATHSAPAKRQRNYFKNLK